MKRVLAIAVICGCLAVSARAQDAGSPEALRAAQELTAIVTSDTMTQMAHSITAQTWPRIEAEFGGKVDAVTLAELRTAFESALSSFTGTVMQDAPAIHAKYFNAAELRDLLAFYRSPIGAKALKTMPQVTADITAQMMPRMQPFQADLAARLDAVMQKHGYKK
jgi:uncharacterized protein